MSNSKDTFWLGADSQPRNALESLALSIFKHHTVGSSFNAKLSGAEWWVQIKKKNVESESIDMHYDKVL